ncbi:Invasion protein IalB, involved in pathogenesis [Rhizobiales bacterium GAS191]|jgi:invasion protein IalB|nr:Invasion protein IalB, involved in pathogenesis [Rhizobiales bacterium GAS113]SEC11093.1 Invasion protein IalB, involved in pathogenesis [Rhizobiales bacterium GAS188]SED11445.1 Invasion protein IalB, involved in pathogenesis [Rhizobiales bacterium GAS191]
MMTRLLSPWLLLSLLATGTAAAATPATGVGATAPSRPKESRLELRLAQAAPQPAAPASSLPGGASSLQETYQDWQVACVQQGAGKHCALSQQQSDSKSQQRVLSIELSMPRPDKAEGVLILPFGLALDKGVILQVDDGAPAPAIRFRTCLPVGCVVPIAFEAPTLAAIRKAGVIKVKVVADNGSDAAFSISLKGFAGALERTVALAR